MAKSKFSVDDLVVFRPAPSAQDTLNGIVTGTARGKAPCCMVKLEGREEPCVCYDTQLEPAGVA